MSLRSDKDRPRKRSPSPSPSPDRPTKQPRTTTQASNTSSHRMSPLRRTETYVSLASFCAPAAITPPPPVPLPPITTTTVPQPSIPSRASTSPESIPYTRTLHYYKEQRERRKAIIRDGLQAEQDPLFLLIANAFFSHPSQPSQPTQQQSHPIQPSIHHPTCPGSPTRALRLTRSARLRAPHQQFPARPKRKQRNSPPRFKPAFTPVSSPLAPRPYTPSTLYNMRSNSHPDCHRLIPRSRPSPDLHRLSIKIRMQHSGGQQLLSLGPRLARKVGDATRELERQVDLENALLTPLDLPGPRPASRPRRPLGRTESVADLSPFMGVAVSHTAAPRLTHDVQMADGWVIDLDQEDWDMLDCT